MSRQFTAASTEYLVGTQSTSFVPTTYPCAFSLWFLFDADNSALSPFCLTDVSDIGGTDNRIQLTKTGDDNFQYFIDSNTTMGVLSGGVDSLSVDTWYHAMAWSTASNAHNVVIDGGTPGTNTTAINFPAVDRNTIGRLENFSGVNYFDGRVAEVACWDTTIPDAGQRAALAKGYSPLHFPAGLMGYWPLTGRHDPEVGRFGGDHLTLTNTPTTGVHTPGIIYPHKRRFYGVPAAAVGGGRVMSSLAAAGGLAGPGGIAGPGGGLAGA